VLPEELDEAVDLLLHLGLALVVPDVADGRVEHGPLHERLGQEGDDRQPAQAVVERAVVGAGGGVCCVGHGATLRSRRSMRQRTATHRQDM
jgi:hypothetical protein